MESKNERKETVFQGIQASPGIAIGTALTIEAPSPEKDVRERAIAQDSVDDEISRLNQALDKTREQLRELQRRVQSKLDEEQSRIFDAHLLIVDDKMLTDEVEELIRNKLVAAEFAFNTIIRRYIAAIAAMNDSYIRDRAADIEDVANRILLNLLGAQAPVLDHLPGQRIIVAKDLTPSDTVILDRENVQAFVIESGSRTSHTAILARSMKIPAVVGVQEIFDVVHGGDLIIIDGYVGTVIVNPTDSTLDLYAQKETREEQFYADLLKENRLRPETIDGFGIQLAANIENIGDLEDVKNYGAAGIGLFRTEYIFMNEDAIPTEREQFEIYKKVASVMNGQSVIIRTLDIGGDKMSSLIGPGTDPNPFLGYRAIRFCLDHEEILRDQIRAILRASAFGNVKMLFPMISCVEELRQVNGIVKEEKERLKTNRDSFNENLEIGIMIEIPSAALISDFLANEVDFFSIGTNDLVQYTLAVDRGNEKVAYLYQPSHPAILALVKMVVEAAKRNRIWVSVCGEMAGDPRYTPILVGMGVHELSMSPISIGPIRRIIRRLRMYDAENVATDAINCDSAEAALELSESLLYKIAPDVMSLALKGL